MSARIIRLAMTPSAVQTFFTPDALARLNTLGVVVDDNAPEASAADIWVTSWSTKIPEKATPQLVVHAGGSVRKLVSLDRIRSGLRVSQPGTDAMPPAVAELALALTLALLRRVHIFDRRLQDSHDWNAARSPALGRSLSDTTVGIVGLSRVGRQYARMTAGVGAKSILAYDPFAEATAAQELGVELVGLDELCMRADVLAIHAPSTESTHHLIGANELSLLRDGSLVINTARSWTTDESALVRELVSGRLSAGLDVFDQEPISPDSPLFGLENVLLTPHVAGGTEGSRRRQGDLVVDEVARFIAQESLRHEVTAELYARLA